VSYLDRLALKLSFTLAELFAMSGFYMSASGVKSARQAAEQSVNFFDSLVSIVCYENTKE
jgi:hypothetical protein